jgi:hypothetical protein
MWGCTFGCAVDVTASGVVQKLSLAVTKEKLTSSDFVLFLGALQRKPLKQFEDQRWRHSSP